MKIAVDECLVGSQFECSQQQITHVRLTPWLRRLHAKARILKPTSQLRFDYDTTTTKN